MYFSPNCVSRIVRAEVATPEMLRLEGLAVGVLNTSQRNWSAVRRGIGRQQPFPRHRHGVVVDVSFARARRNSACPRSSRTGATHNAQVKADHAGTKLKC